MLWLLLLERVFIADCCTPVLASIIIPVRCCQGWPAVRPSYRCVYCLFAAMYQFWSSAWPVYDTELASFAVVAPMLWVDLIRHFVWVLEPDLDGLRLNVCPCRSWCWAFLLFSLGVLVTWFFLQTHFSRLLSHSPEWSMHMLHMLAPYSVQTIYTLYNDT